MARTGINIQVSDTVLGGLPSVNANSLIVVCGAVATSGGGIAFSLNTPYMLQSRDDLKLLGIDATNNPAVYNQVSDFYAPKSGLNNSGTILWLVGVSDDPADVADLLAGWVRATVVNGNQYRPRNIIISLHPENGDLDAKDIQAVIDELYTEGFATVALLSKSMVEDAINVAYATLPDLAQAEAPMVGTVIVTNRQLDRACVGAIGGWMASLSVGTSIGDMQTSAFSNSLYYVDGTLNSGVITWINTPCANVTPSVINTLGDKQYIFARTRLPKNGLWLNDGATANSGENALSTLEAARTIASIVDDLRAYFINYINTPVPVNRAGDIDPTYKQTVVDGARSKVIQPYIPSDISDADIQLVAKNNDMIGTRTWEVTLQILPAVTLRWVDGFVFYVNSLD